MCVECSLLTQAAVGADYQADLSKHGSQTDAAKGFGGKFGVQSDRKDKVRTSCSTLVHGTAAQTRQLSV